MDRENDVLDFLIDVVGNSKKMDSEKALSKVHKRIALESRRKFLSITYKVQLYSAFRLLCFLRGVQLLFLEIEKKSLLTLKLELLQE